MKKLLYGASLIPLFLFASISTFAQDGEGPNYIAVRSVTTHAGGAETWIEQQEKLAEAHRERGDPTRHIWQEVIGDVDTFHVVTFPESLGGNNQGPPMSDRAWERWVDAISPTVQSRKTRVWQAFPELSIPANSDLEYMVLRYVNVKPGQHAAFQTWLTEKYIPALKSIDAAGFGVSRLRHGDDTGTWLITHRIESPAALDGPPPIFALSQEERTELLVGVDDMTLGQERRIVRYLANLSHTQEEEE